MTKTKTNFRGNIRRDAERQRTSGGSSYLNLPKGIKLYNIEPDTRRVKLDFLPYTVTDPKHLSRDDKNEVALPGMLWWRKPILLHTNVGPNRERVICPRTVGKACPICEHQKKRFNEGAPKDETKEYYPQKRSLFAVIPVDQDDEEIFIWDMSDKLFLETLTEELEEDDSNENFPSLEDGKTMEISLKWNVIGEKGKPFPEARSIRFNDREAYSEDILDEVPNLDEVLNILSYNEIYNKFFELEDEETGGKLKDIDDEDENTRPRKRFHNKERNEDPEDESKKTVRRERKRKTEEPEQEPEQDEQPKEERRKRRSSIKEDDTSKDDERCPYGHIFGEDTDKYTDCDKCKIWDACIDEKEK